MAELHVEATKDHDLLVRLDEKMDGLGKTLTALVTSLDQRGADIEELKTAKLLHDQETKQQIVDFNVLEKRVSTLESTSSTTNANIQTLKDSSILLLAQKHQKLATIIVIIFLIMLNFHDILVPWLFSLAGYKVP